MKRLLLPVSLVLALMFALAPEADAARLNINYALPTSDCDGAALDAADILETEFYISASDIPASDTPCPAPGGPVDAPPATYSALIVDNPVTGNVKVDLIGGVTYYVRARVRTAGGWSNLSNQMSFDLPETPGQAPVIIRFGF